MRTLSHVSEKEPLALALPRLAAEEEAAGGPGGAALPSRLLQPASPWMCEGERWARPSRWTFPWLCGRRRAWEARGLLPRPLRVEDRAAGAARSGGRSRWESSRPRRQQWAAEARSPGAGPSLP